MEQRTSVTVLPSGVEMEVRAFIGGDMERLSMDAQEKGVDAFNELLANCIIRLGNDRSITLQKIQKMLSNDRKYGLLYLRNFSLNFKPTFDFTHEWPVEEDGQGKDTTDHSILLRGFPMRPYYWVAEVMERMREEAESKGESFDNSKFPKMFESYEEVYPHLEQVTKLNNTGIEVHWKILTASKEKEFAEVGPKQRHLNLPIVMRVPRIMLEPKSGKEPVPTIYETSKGDWGDLEQLRAEIHKKEGKIDTMITIKHPNKSKEASVDLIGTLAFFVPSQAI